jgi:3-phosphoshikimate 1-carboxyvinyltransferase
MELWNAPFRGKKPLNAVITIPGSKSATNRALILAALAKTPSLIKTPLFSRDSELMIAGLKSLGIRIEEIPTNDPKVPHLKITPAPLMGPSGIDVGNAGTVMRFLPPVAAFAQGIIHFDGDPRSHERPLGPVIKALEDLGTTINHDNRYSLPLTINGSGKLRGGKISIDASASSQFLSALLLIGTNTEEGIHITHTGDHLPSLPHIEMSISMVHEFGGTITTGIDESNHPWWFVAPGELKGLEYQIEPDLSNAAPFIGAAMICGGSVTVRHWPRQTTQAGDALRDILSRMGATVELNDAGLTVTGGSEIAGIDIDLSDVGELTPSIAAIASLATTDSYLRGIGHLRLHETDRLNALATELNALGGDVEEEATALRIFPSELHAGVFHTYEDHRLGTAGAMIGLATEGIEVENIATTRKTLPDFPGLWSEMLNQNSRG